MSYYDEYYGEWRPIGHLDEEISSNPFAASFLDMPRERQHSRQHSGHNSGHHSGHHSRHHQRQQPPPSSFEYISQQGLTDGNFEFEEYGLPRQAASSTGSRRRNRRGHRENPHSAAYSASASESDAMPAYQGPVPFRDMHDYIIEPGLFKLSDHCMINYKHLDRRTIEITFFACSGHKKHDGARLMRDFLLMIQQDFPRVKKIFLNADANVGLDEGRTRVSQVRLNQYYTEIGFTQIDEYNNFEGSVRGVLAGTEAYIRIKTGVAGNPNKRTLRNKRTYRNKRTKKTYRNKRTLRNKRRHNKKTRKKYSKHYR